MERLPYLSSRMDRDVYEHQFTGAFENEIFIEPQYVQLIERGGKLWTRSVRWQPKRTAKAVYYLLHEYAHSLQGRYLGEVSELAANDFAAANYRSWCEKLGYTPRATARLWNALPDFYKHPTAI